ncbi:uncharacterized protein LOC122508642 [Leptopilina heterotoma]|uniref:uncharacterized protein LOC122508642 n=1 Tax=Leptopilina heterotoma TaxID=63436 RepID=UPI001CA9BF72|nr:uncharacterized protein LOC122508642 [Leptopilina heterotoma]
MNSAFKGRFFPNECFICKSRRMLIRCDCKMIAYCSEEHRLQHLPIHESFCKAVREVIKEKGLKHISERILNTNTTWDNVFQYMINFEKKLGRCMTPLEISMWVRPRVCFYCRDSRLNLYDCPDCPIVSFCKSHRRNQMNSHNCGLMNRYLKTLSVAEELNIDMQFLPSRFPYISEDRFDIFDPLTHTVYDTSSSILSISTKENLIHFINIASKLNVALEKIYDTTPEKIIIHIVSFSNDHAIIIANHWEFFLHVNPKIRNLKIVITQNYSIESSLENYSLCEKCVKLEKTLSVEKYLSSYKEYMLKENYQVPDILFNFRFENCYYFDRFNDWNEIGCPIILLPNSKSKHYKMPFFLSFLYENLEMFFNGKINTAFNEEAEYDEDSYFIIFKTKKIKKQEISPADNSSENDDTSLTPTKDDSILIENNNERACEEEIAEDNSSAEETEKQNLKTLSPSSSFSSFTIVSEPKEGDNNVEKIVNNDNSIADDDLESLCKENESLFTENSSLKAEIEKLQHELSSSTEKVSKLQQELNSSTDKVVKLEKRNVELEKIGFHLNEKIQSIDEIFQTLKMETSLRIKKENS